jgi:Protein phosphatase 2C
MNSDCGYRIGRSHAVCQDYAVARGGEQPYVIVADGCSSSPDTDIGARLLVKAAEAFIGSFPGKGSEGAAFDGTCIGPAGGSGTDAYHRQTIVTARAHAALLGVCDRALDATLLTAAVRGERWLAAVWGDGVVAMKDREGRIHVRSVTFAEGLPRYLNYAADPARQAAFLARSENHWSVERLVMEPDGAVVGKERELLPADGSRVAFWATGAVAEYAWVAILSDGIHSFTEARVTETGRTSAPVPLAVALRELLAFKNANGVFVQRRLQRLLRSEGSREGFPYTHYDDLAMGVIELGG